MLPRNQVYRAVEKTAHGMLSWQRQDVIVSGALGAVTAMIMGKPVAGLVGFGAGLVLVLVGRQAWEGRRDYVLLLLRRLQRERHLRALDPDRDYRVYERGGR